MVTESEQTKFNLTILREGLNAIGSSSAEQLLLNKKGLEHLDDVFDPMPLDYLPWLEDKNEISQSFSKQVRDLYQKIENSVGHLEWQEVDTFIAKDGSDVEQWRELAKYLIGELDGV
jgi:DNA-binding XRE family transcriptional regulator